MKKNRVHILTAIFSVMLIALFSLSANAYISLDEDDLTKTVNNVKYHMFESEGEKRAIAYEFVADEEMTELNILSEVDGYKVTSVEATSFFKSFPKVTEITIGENVESLSFHTFASFKSLKKVNLPSTLTSIGDEVFAGCSSLESMNLEYVTYIGTEAFQNCTALKEVTFSENLKTIGSRSFRNTGFETITIPSKAYLSGTESFAVVGEQFRDCVNLKTVIFEDRADISKPFYIDEWAFNGCISLETVILPQNVSDIKIYDAAFLTVKV